VILSPSFPSVRPDAKRRSKKSGAVGNPSSLTIMPKLNRLALSRLIKKKEEEMLLCTVYVKASKPDLCKVLLNKSKQCREYV
jgi:hypothetical protein